MDHKYQMSVAEKFLGADCMLTAEEISILLGCTKATARELMHLQIIPSIDFSTGGRRTAYKTRKFAFNEAVTKLDGKNLNEIIANKKSGNLISVA